MTGRSLPLFPASVVGSIPRPLVVRELIEKPHWDAADSATMDAAIRFVVAMQERAGAVSAQLGDGAAKYDKAIATVLAQLDAVAKAGDAKQRQAVHKQLNGGCRDCHQLRRRRPFIFGELPIAIAIELLHRRRCGAVRVHLRR